MKTYDIAVVGGGINGCGIARDAAGRGHSVFLAEQDDLASGTSSWSSKLVHGGLRYLEHYEFRLVREALREREVLLEMAPHIIRPLRFVLPHSKDMRPSWLLRFGLLLYDSLGGRKRLPGTRKIDLERDPAGAPLKSEFRRAFEYSDCWVDDARLVALNAVSAADRGARIETRTRVTGISRERGLWRVTAADVGTGETETLLARAVVNAAGPWIDRVLEDAAGRVGARNVRLVKGSHIVVRRFFEHDRAYILQNADKRIIFAIPYEGEWTLIGTTDEDYDGDPGDARISDEEVGYLLASANEYFADAVTRDDIVWTYSGVRPLYDDGASEAQEATRDYVLKLEGGGGEPVLLNIFGGKITTYRRLAEEAVGRIEKRLDEERRPTWTAAAPLPGGDFPVEGFDGLVASLASEHPGLDAALLRRLARAYGTVARTILSGAERSSDLGRDFGAGLFQAEIDHLVQREWARTGEDVLWRRTKLGLRLSGDERAAVDVAVRETAARLVGAGTAHAA